MSLVNRTLHDGDTESLISKFLKAGVMIKEEFQNKHWNPTRGNYRHYFNIILNELDKELEARGLHYTRYADDVIIVVKSEAAAKRVMYSITDWIERN
jgi:retron-type reverse transcriptase